MDRFGIDSILSFEDRVRTVAQLCARASMQARWCCRTTRPCFLDWYAEGLLPRILPRWNYLHIHRHVIPALRQQGVTDEQIRTMMVDNPKRIFDTAGSY